MKAGLKREEERDRDAPCRRSKEPLTKREGKTYKEINNKTLMMRKKRSKGGTTIPS